MRFSIRSRLLLFSILLILLSVSVTAAIALYIQINSLEGNQRHYLEELAEIVGINIQDPLYQLKTHKLRMALQPMQGNDDFARTLVLDTRGTVLSDGTEENRLQ